MKLTVPSSHIETYFFKLVLILLTLFSISNAHAEGGGTSAGGGGGDILICGKSKFDWFPWVDGPSYYLADLYQIFHDKNISLNTDYSTDVWEQSIIETLNSKQPGFGDYVNERMKSLIFSPVEYVPELDDDNISIPKGCIKKQLAIQNLATGEVVYSEKLAGELSSLQFLFFKYHEAFVSIKKKKTDQDTTPIRKEILDLSINISITDVLTETARRYFISDSILNRIDSSLFMFAVLAADFEKKNATVTGCNLKQLSYMEACTTVAFQQDGTLTLFAKAAEVNSFKSRATANSNYGKMWVAAHLARLSGFKYERLAELVIKNMCIPDIFKFFVLNPSENLEVLVDPRNITGEQIKFGMVRLQRFKLEFKARAKNTDIYDSTIETIDQDFQRYLSEVCERNHKLCRTALKEINK